MAQLIYIFKTVIGQFSSKPVTTFTPSYK